jgi:hypothetical protein
VIADEDDERALRPAHVGERVAFTVHTFELEVTGLPAEVANACFRQCHYKPSALLGIAKDLVTQTLPDHDLLARGMSHPITFWYGSRRNFWLGSRRLR